MTDDVTIREATVDDAQALTRLGEDLGFGGTIGELQLRLAALIASSDHGVFVAVAPDGRLAGWAHVAVRHFLEARPYAELSGMAVSSRHRQSGLGRRLIAAAEHWGGAQGLLALRLRSSDGGDQVRRFYESIGYRYVRDQRVFEKELKAA
jgi:GNAT superfamily N-acetyltransferase